VTQVFKVAQPLSAVTQVFGWRSALALRFTLPA
jgi:hypothetical protein